MAITSTLAQVAVARALGNAADTDQLAAALDAIKAAIAEWNIRRDWRFLNMDTSGGFTVAACTSNGANPSIITTTTSNGFAGVNVGQTATGLSGTATVASVQSTTQFTATTQVTGGPVTLTFSADIPLVAGTQTYNLPSPVKRIYDARLLTNPRTLIWKDQREIDLMFASDLTSRGTPEYYNIFNAASFSASGAQNGVVRVFRIPSEADTLSVRYYRPIAEPATGSDYIDVLDRYVYALLDLARYYYMRDHDADNPRTGDMEKRAEKLFRECWADDDGGSEDRESALVPRIEHDITRRFDPNVPFGGV